MNRLLLSCAMMALLTGCGWVRAGSQSVVEHIHGMDTTTHALGSPMSTTQTFWVLDGLSVINTQKTIDDHLVSWISGKDCSTIKAIKGEDYCQAKPVKTPTVARTSYCYKNLAGTTCYTQPLPGQATLAGTHTEQVPLTMGDTVQ